MRARWRARKAARPSQQQENFGGPSQVKSWVHRRRGASSQLPPQRFYVICESLKFGRAALAAAVAAPELIQGRRQHEGVRPARAIRNPCAAVVACWPGIEAKLIRQLNDRGLPDFLRGVRRPRIAPQLLSDCSYDTSQLATCEQARQIWRSRKFIGNPCTDERVQKSHRRFILSPLARSATNTAAGNLGFDPLGITTLACRQVLLGRLFGVCG